MEFVCAEEFPEQIDTNQVEFDRKRGYDENEGIQVSKLNIVKCFSAAVTQ